MGYDLYWVTKADGEDAEVAAAQAEFNILVAARDSLPKAERGEFSDELYKAARAAGDHSSMTDYKFFPGISSRYIAAADAVHEAYDRMEQARKSYFRFNMSGMGRACDVMEHTGMLFTDTDVPSYPDAEDFGVTWDDVEAVEYGSNPEYEYSARHLATMTASTRAAARKYLAERDRVLSYHGKADTPGIPDHKFSSNDGWHVVPAECQAAARIYMGWLEKTGVDAARNYVENTFGSFARWNEWVAWIGEAARHDGFRVR